MRRREVIRPPLIARRTNLFKLVHQLALFCSRSGRVSIKQQNVPSFAVARRGPSALTGQLAEIRTLRARNITVVFCSARPQIFNCSNRGRPKRYRRLPASPCGPFGGKFGAQLCRNGRGLAGTVTPTHQNDDGFFTSIDHPALRPPPVGEHFNHRLSGPRQPTSRLPPESSCRSGPDTDRGSRSAGPPNPLGSRSAGASKHARDPRAIARSRGGSLRLGGLDRPTRRCRTNSDCVFQSALTAAGPTQLSFWFLWFQSMSGVGLAVFAAMSESHNEASMFPN